MTSPSPSPRVALVAGCTGAIGKCVVSRLVESKDFTEIRLLVRRPVASSLPPSSVPVSDFIVSDFTDRPSYPPSLFDGVHVVFCCLGSTRRKAGSDSEFFRQDHDVIMAVAESARAAPSVSVFSLVSSVGATAQSGSLYIRTKGVIEDECRALKFPKLSIWRPSVLEADRGEFRCGECVGICCVKYLCGCCFYTCMAEYAAIDVNTVARAMITDSVYGEKGDCVFDGSQRIEKVAKGK